MNPVTLAAVQNDPVFRELVSRRSRFAWWLTALTLIVYLGFIFLIAFEPKALATPIDGVITVGLPVGLFVILCAIVLTGIYVRRANSEFDRMTYSIVKRLV